MAMLADYRKHFEDLYQLQDQVMELVFNTESEFYLTGGTCLSRFYQAKRYSDDLDFFTHDSHRFSFAVRAVRRVLEDKFPVQLQLDTKNFVRLEVDKKLQVDFVNDSVIRESYPVSTPQGYLIDTIENILSNKLTAIIGRDNPKDIFDLLLIHTYYSVNWTQILTTAHLKAFFTVDDLIMRLRSFPKEMLNSIQCIDCAFLNSFDDSMTDIITQITESI